MSLLSGREPSSGRQEGRSLNVWSQQESLHQSVGNVPSATRIAWINRLVCGLRDIQILKDHYIARISKLTFGHPFLVAGTCFVEQDQVHLPYRAYVPRSSHLDPVHVSMYLECCARKGNASDRSSFLHCCKIQDSMGDVNGD